MRQQAPKKSGLIGVLVAIVVALVTTLITNWFVHSRAQVKEVFPTTGIYRGHFL
jgi:hypothetical protein